ncbi:hypothetical protein PAECIP111893_05325 [Paenibacillus plantiphilus]|uniref:Uncharacterized protein n=1 Tax=Paenibacillus plantiphilus TaxID=2905650 RepID=A0ABM9CWE2_9BACL|nr:hypothetical protein PAECIP111893_05325 [Paenibacillus plantiphilus]
MRRLFRLSQAMVIIGLSILWIQGARIQAASSNKPEVLVEGEPPSVLQPVHTNRLNPFIELWHSWLKSIKNYAREILFVRCDVASDNSLTYVGTVKEIES